MQRRQLITLAAATSILPLAVFAQTDFPNRPLKMIVPFPPGGTSDVMARLIAEEMSKILKQPIPVENVGGAGGAIGAKRGAEAPADGYTLTLTGVGSNAVHHGLNPNVGYDSNRDFYHLTQIQNGPNVLVVHPDQPFKTFKDLIAYVKANPGKMNYAYTPAASGHMAMEQLKLTAGLFVVGIPYRGGGPMLTDLLGGQIPMMFINQDVALQHVKAGKLMAVAVTSAQRNPLYSDVPTIAESGYPGFEANSWSGVSVPRATPKPILDKLEAAAVQAMSQPGLRQKLESQGFVIPPLGSAHYTKFVASEIDRWTRVIKAAGIKPE